MFACVVQAFEVTVRLNGTTLPSSHHSGSKAVMVRFPLTLFCLNQQVQVDVADSKGRFEILKVHARNKKLSDDVDLKEIAMRTPGFSGADLANLLNEVCDLARTHVYAHALTSPVCACIHLHECARATRTQSSTEGSSRSK
jgi:hypothetical protein